MPIKIDNSFHFSGKTIFGSSKASLLTFLEKALNEKKGLKIVFTPNPEQLVLADEDPEFNRILKHADVLVPDGVGVTWSSKILARDKSQRIKETIPGRVLVADLIKAARKNDLRVLLIGGKDYSPTGEIKIAGQVITWTPGYVDVSKPSDQEEKAFCKLIREVRPDIVFVAFGAPNQEKWLISHMGLLHDCGVKVAMVVGGSFDYLLGKVPSPPKFISQIGMEWLFRLITQPWRLKRQLKLIKFVWIVLMMRLGFRSR